MLGSGRRQTLPILARDKAAGWRKIGQLVLPRDVRLSGAELAERIRQGGFRRVAPRYQALEIGDIRLEPRLH
ncbi:hypothetical protein D3C85_1771270 [compost metagenome]